MSLSRFTLLMAVLAGCGTGASAERLLPDYLRQTVEPSPVSQFSAAFGLNASSDDAEPANYLAEATAADNGRANAMAAVPLPSGRWLLSQAPAAADGQVEIQMLIEALNALGPIAVSVADYLALLAGPDISSAGSGSPPRVGAAKVHGTSLSSPPPDPAPGFSATPAPTARVEQPGHWALSPAMSERLTRYLVGAAALAILLGAGLRLAVLTRRNAPPALARL